MTGGTKAFLFALKKEVTVIKTALFLLIVLLAGNLNAIVDSVLHPEIPYFDQEHLIVGSAYALLVGILLLGLGSYHGTRKQAETALKKSEEQYRSIFDNAGDIIFTVTKDTFFTSLNPAFERITGWQREERLGKSFSPVVHPDDLPKAVGILQKIMQEETVEMFELRVLKKSGEYFIGEFTVATIRQGETVTALGHVRDITDRKMLEEKNKKLNEELEMRVEERTRQLIEAQDELIRKEKLAFLGQLSGSVGHELRNPLGVISNAVYFLQTTLSGADETVKEYLDIIKSEVSNSIRIISDLLDFSRTRTPQTRSIPIHELIRQSLDKCSIPEGITVNNDIPEGLPLVRVDPVQMGQVFQNLIMNAMQAMAEGGTLHINAQKGVGDNACVGCTVGAGLVPAHGLEGQPQELPLQKDNNFIDISVTDTGEGISPENISRLFQPLFTTKARGIGLGLALSKRIIEANNGCIEVQSRTGKGTTFTVILPAEK